MSISKKLILLYYFIFIIGYWRYFYHAIVYHMRITMIKLCTIISSTYAIASVVIILCIQKYGCNKPGHGYRFYSRYYTQFILHILWTASIIQQPFISIVIIPWLPSGRRREYMTVVIITIIVCIFKRIVLYAYFRCRPNDIRFSTVVLLTSDERYRNNNYNNNYNYINNDYDNINI